MLEQLCAALLMRAIQHLPYGFRLDNDGTTYAWDDLAYLTGYRGPYLPEDGRWP